MSLVDPAVDAPGARSWSELVTVLRRCTVCAELAATRTQVVPGVRPDDGSRPQLLIVGEAPGAQEDALGVPFVGRSGQLLDRLLAEAGVARDRVAVANVLKCRPPGNRTPRRGEVARCRPWLERQITLLDPAVVLALGSTAAGWFAGPAARIGDLRTRDLRHDGRPLLVSYHPSAAIRFGPRGAPLAALREDLARAAALAGAAA